MLLLLARSLRRSQLGSEEEKLASFDREIERQQSEVKANQNEINKYNEILPLAQERMSMKQDLLQKGLTPKTEMLTIQQQLIEMQRDRDTAAAHLAEAKSQIASIQRQKAQAQEEFKRDRLKELADAETQGQAPGKVKTVSEDALSGGSNSTAAFAQARNDQAHESGGAASSPNQLFYAARVTLDRTTMNVDGKTVNLAPGMAATIEIKTGRRKLIEYLLSPLMRMTQEAGRER